MTDSPNPSRVASRRIAQQADQLDQVARARVLEAAGGHRAWSLAERPGALFSEAPGLFPDADPAWYSSRNQGLWDALLDGTSKVIKGEAGELTAEEIAQNMLFGLSPTGSRRSDVFGDVGEYKAKAILSGRLGPRDIQGTVSALAQRRALDTWRKEVRKKRQREKAHPTVVTDDPATRGEVPAEVAVDRTPMDVTLSLLSTPKGREFRQWIYRVIQNKATDVQKAVMEATFDHISSRDEWPSAKKIQDEVAARMGGNVISVQAINEHRRNVVKLIQREMASNPKVLHWIEDYLDLAELGYGGGSFRRASASRVAARFLSAR